MQAKAFVNFHCSTPRAGFLEPALAHLTPLEIDMLKGRVEVKFFGQQEFFS